MTKSDRMVQKAVRGPPPPPRAPRTEAVSGKVIVGVLGAGAVIVLVALGLRGGEERKPAAVTASSSACPAGMREIPGGTFSMGSTDGDADEKPVHEVTLSSYCLDETEVTVAAYAQCPRATCRAPKTGGYCNAAGAGKEDHPQNCVSWDDAVAFCRWANKRLPTEAEWEFAARGGKKGLKWPWGDTSPTDALACWIHWDKKLATCPVKAHPAATFELHGMAGNVWEWVSDWYAPYPSTTSTNAGPSTGSSRVARGGSWDHDYHPANLRGANRNFFAPDARDSALGFRCAGNR